LPDEKIVVFAHGGVIRALVCHWLSLDPSNYLMFDVRPASITTIKLFEMRGVLVGLDNSISEGEEKNG
jgi:alpha-ribazole phosphatase